MTAEELEELGDISNSTSREVKLEDLVKHETEGVTKANAPFVEETLRSLNSGSMNQGDEGEGREECPLCLDIIEIHVLIPPCMHKWCVHKPGRVDSDAD